MAGERTVKIKFLGESSGVARAARAAERSIRRLNEGTQDVFENMGKSLVSTFSSSGIYGAAAIVAAVVAAAPAIGAALSAAIPLAFGGGAVALGIVAALKDPKVAAAFEPLKKLGQQIFTDFGAEFKGPLIKAAQTFTAALEAMRPTFTSIAKAAAPIVDMLAPALASMATNSLPGIKAMVDASVPLFQILADKAPALGTAFSQFLEAIAKGGPGAQKFLQDVFDFLIVVIPKVGSLIGWLSNRYVDWRNGVIKVISAVKAAWNGFYSFFASIGTSIGSAIGRVIASFNNFKNKASAAWNSVVATVRSAVDTIEGIWNHLRSIASQAINFSVGGLGGLGSLFGGFRAAGGPVTAGRPYVVGERGAELFVPSSSGKIVPNDQMGGGGPEILNLTLDLGRGIQQVIQINLKEHDRQLKRAVGV